VHFLMDWMSRRGRRLNMGFVGWGSRVVCIHLRFR
jgi:hypothetical protein